MVRYVGEMVPGHRPEMGLTAGSNCQRYAYAVLRHFALSVPDLRSSDLWVDQGSTMSVANPAALDLVLYAPTRDPWGAHVGVFLGGSSVLHLCQEVGVQSGVQAVWDFDDFRRSRSLPGTARIQTRSPPTRTPVAARRKASEARAADATTPVVPTEPEG